MEHLNLFIWESLLKELQFNIFSRLLSHPPGNWMGKGVLYFQNGMRLTNSWKQPRQLAPNAAKEKIIVLVFAETGCSDVVTDLPPGSGYCRGNLGKALPKLGPPLPSPHRHLRFISMGSESPFRGSHNIQLVDISNIPSCWLYLWSFSPHRLEISNIQYNSDC